MTHEHQPSAEATDGPEHDHDLPDATDVPEFSDVEQSFDPPMDDAPRRRPVRSWQTP